MGVSSYVGLYSLCALFVITTLVVPIIQIMEMLYIWFVPMKPKTLERHLVAFEICQAWQDSEVYLISILAASLQLGEVSTYFVNDFCGSLDYLFAFAVNYGLLEFEDSQCFYVDPALKDGFYLLLIACIFLWLFSFIVMKIANIVFEERREELIAKSGNDCETNATNTFPERFFGLGYWSVAKQWTLTLTRMVKMRWACLLVILLFHKVWSGRTFKLMLILAKMKYL